MLGLKRKKGILYLIADCEGGLAPIEEALRAGVDYLQLREKNISSAEYLNGPRAVKGLCEAYRTPLIINDRADIALLCGADGVHLGASDIPVDEARRLLGRASSSAPRRKPPPRPHRRRKKAPTTWAAALFSNLYKI